MPCASALPPRAPPSLLRDARGSFTRNTVSPLASLLQKPMMQTFNMGSAPHQWLTFIVIGTSEKSCMYVRHLGSWKAFAQRPLTLVEANLYAA